MKENLNSLAALAWFVLVIALAISLLLLGIASNIFFAVKNAFNPQLAK